MTTPTVPTTTAALLVNDRRQYLLHLRDANKPIQNAGQWSLPGGHPEEGESPEETIARELLEETGLRIPDLTAFVVVETTGPGGRVTGRVQVYAGTWNGDPAQLPLTEGIMLRWTDPGELGRLTMDPKTTPVVRHHQAAPRRTRGDNGSLPVIRVPGDESRTVLNVIGVHLYLERDREILLGLRHPDSVFAGNQHLFLTGHCEQESAVACLIREAREAREEAGLVIEPEDVELAHAVHILDAPGTQPRLQLVFRARRWEGEPQVMEPDKCVSWGWWDPDALAERTVGYARVAIDGIRHGRAYTELGWG